MQLAKVTRGALYHHYKDKRALFEAVFEELAARSQSASSATPAGQDPLAALVAGCEAWLMPASIRSCDRSLLIDGPSVLGWRRWSEIDARHGTRSLRVGIEACSDAGALVGVDAGVLTRLLAGAVNDVALLLAAADDARALRRTAGMTLRRLLDGLKVRARR